MKDLTHEQTEIALTTLDVIVRSRDVKQQQLADISHVSQPTIAHILNRSRTPSRDQLTKLFDALGLKLESVLELDEAPARISGYLATPLTALVKDPKKEAVLNDVVRRIMSVADDVEFKEPPFQLYWPGDHSHPDKNAELTSEAVYGMDRSRAGTSDFLIMVCAEPSYGVGQENEIATQAGVPMIRLVPPQLTRMMTGSFANARNITYQGSFSTAVNFNCEELKEELQNIRVDYFHRRTLYKNLNGNVFGRRLQALIDARTKGAASFAEDLGISVSYVLTLINEPLAVSNPGTILLKKIARRLDTKLSHLLGEAPDLDPVWIESHEALRRWVAKTPDAAAHAYLTIRDSWRAEYQAHRDAVSILSNRAPQTMTEEAWDNRYRAYVKNTKRTTSASPSLF